AYPAESPDVEIDPDAAAYAVLSTDSAGTPNAIFGTHGALSHFLQWHSRAFDINESDRFAMFSGPSQNNTPWDIFVALWVGATLRIPDAGQTGFPQEMARWMRDEQITSTHLTPAMAQSLAQTASGAAGCQIPSLRYAFLPGGVLTKGLVSKLRRLAPRATCVNLYQTTEMAQPVACFVLPDEVELNSYEPTEADEKKNIPLGRGIDGAQLLVLNRNKQLAGVGELGEIYIRTPYLSMEQIGGGAEIKERFSVNPFTNRASDQIYRTGDAGRYLPDGNAEFVGRAGRRMKRRLRRPIRQYVKDRNEPDYSARESARHS
ncbi:MAG TPA: AMP-binding protein, partial [Blastocatellia bacterium]|nr:AMP-binding protein [Blastocatellia bacterium]